MQRALSISLRLTLWFGSILLGGWMIFGAAMWFNLKHALTVERKQTLDRRLDRLQDLLTRDAQRSDAARYNDFHDFASATGNGLVEIFLPSGKRYWPSPSAASENFSWPVFTASTDHQYDSVDSNGAPYRTLERSFRLASTPVVLACAAPEGGNVLLLNRFWSSLLASAPMLLLVSMAGGYWISRRALRPVAAITAAARSIGIRNLSERLPVTSSGDELDRLAETCNDMLERLEVAVRKLRQFTADASHELRRPLTLTRTIADLSLLNPRIDVESRAAFEEIAEETIRSTALLAQMLELARIDAEPADISLERTDLTLLIEEACTAARSLAQQQNMTLTLDSQPAYIFGNSSTLRRLLWILLDNAIKYTHSGGRIDVAMRGDQQRVRVTIADTGIGIAPEHIPRIWDRFYRADASRSEVEGNGLGLAIAKWIVELHHANIMLHSQENIGTIVTLQFDREALKS